MSLGQGSYPSRQTKNSYQILARYYFSDKRYGRDTNEIKQNKSNMNLPVKKDKNGRYKLPSGAFVRVCMASDFFLVLAGGENYLGSRPLQYEWVKKLHDQCEKYDIHLIFGQTGNVFIKDGKEYKFHSRTDQMIQALESGLHYPPVDIEAEIRKIKNKKESMQAQRNKNKRAKC